MPRSLSKHEYASPRWSAEITDCGVPMSLDQYSRCSYDCVYCFSQFQKDVGLAKKAYRNQQEVRAVKVDRIKRMFTNPTTKSDLQFAEFIKRRFVLQWGGLADPFDENERRFGIGLELLRFFKSIDYPITFSTKSVWWTKDQRYTSLFKGQRNWNVKVSIITLDEAKRRAIERGVPSSKARLGAIRRIAKWKCGGATLRFRPFMIGVSDPRHCELVNEAAERGADAVSMEFFCMEVRSQRLRRNFRALQSLLGFDMFAFYRKFSSGTGYLRLNRNVKRPFVDAIEATCKEHGVRFYVSDAHFKERCHNSCCCGLPASWNYTRGQWNEALQIAKKRGRVRWKDFEKDLRYAKKFLFRNSQGFNTRTSKYRVKFYDFTMYDWLRYLWNHPNTGNGPYHLFEGILAPVSTDKQGDIVYRYDASRE